MSEPMWRTLWYAFMLWYPSESHSNIIRITFITIGSREQKEGPSDQNIVDQSRHDSQKAFEEYQHRLRMRKELCRGDSIIRGFFVLDEKHFIIEQEMSVSINFVGKTWAGRKTNAWPYLLNCC